MTSVLSLHEVSKRFPGVKALDGVSLDLVPGSVTALIGENGAGKSTIVKILTGIYRPDEGEVRIDGDIVRLGSPRDAWAAGVAAIHQETVMFDELSVAENVFMGHMPGGVLIDPGDMRDRTAALLARIEADFAAIEQIQKDMSTSTQAVNTDHVAPRVRLQAWRTPRLRGWPCPRSGLRGAAAGTGHLGYRLPSEHP